MKRTLLLLLVAVAAGASRPAAAASHAGITPAEIAAAVNRFGIPVAPEQVVLLSDVQAATAHPQLRVESVQRWGGAQVMARLSCADAGECVPFFVGLRLNAEGQTQVAMNTAVAPNAERSAAHATLVHAGVPATLYLDGDHVHIRLTVICLENGVLGQTIRATDKERRMVYQAQVADSGVLKGRL